MPRRVTRMCDWLPYQSHPLFRLRVATVLTILLGLLFVLFAILSYIWDDRDVVTFFVFQAVFLFLSFVYIFHDLVTYAISTLSTRRTSTLNDIPEAVPDNRPYSNAASTWPSKRLIISDLIFAIIFQWLFWCGFAVVINSYHHRYYSGPDETFANYANLANFAASIEHGVAFWKELIARKKAAWMRDLEAQPCRNCGHVERPTLEAQLLHAERTSNAPADGDLRPSSRSSFLDRISSSKATLPKWVTRRKSCTCQENDEDTIKKSRAQDDFEEPLLVTPEDSTTEVGESSRAQGYGTLSQSVESVEAIPELLVKKKDKGKKRLVEV